MSARTTTCPHITPATIAGFLYDEGVRLMDVQSDDRLATRIVYVFERRNLRLGRASNDFDAIRAELTARIHAHIADPRDPEHLAAVEAGSRAFAARVGKGPAR